MSTFNYRVFRKQDALGNDYFEIHEVYYNEEGKVIGLTAKPKTPFGYTKEELKENLERMLAALDNPIWEEGLDVTNDCIRTSMSIVP